MIWLGCGCSNQCECNSAKPNSAATTTAPWLPPRAAICEDYWLENLIIGIIAWLLSALVCLFVHERCVKPCCTFVKTERSDDPDVNRRNSDKHGKIHGMLAA